MLAQGFLNPVEEAHARLQEQVAKFLAGRSKLLRLQNHKSVQIQSDARGLYAVQVQLENDLQNRIMPMIDRMKSGSWALSDVLTVGNFTQMVIRHISDVDNLERRAGGVPADTGMSALTIAGIGVPVLLVGSVALYFMFRK